MLPVILTILLLPVAVILLINFNLYIQCKSNGLAIGFVEILFIRVRHLSPQVIIEALVRLHRSNLSISSSRLQSHLLAGGDLDSVVEAYISANRSSLPFDFEKLCSIDLAGRDVLDAVESYVNPLVIHCPLKGREKSYMVGVTQDGIRLGVQVKVTVRVDLNKLIGGAGESTIRARVGEGVISSIGKEKDHKAILERPEIISKRIQSSGLLAGTAYELVSVDVLEIDIIDNIGAKIMVEQSEADKQIAQAMAESAKSEAFATQQEMKAKKKRMQAGLVMSKASLPSAMSNAYLEGNVGLETQPIKDVFQK